MQEKVNAREGSDYSQKKRIRSAKVREYRMGIVGGFVKERRGKKRKAENGGLLMETMRVGPCGSHSNRVPGEKTGVSVT